MSFLDDYDGMPDVYDPNYPRRALMLLRILLWPLYAVGILKTLPTLPEPKQK